MIIRISLLAICPHAKLLQHIDHIIYAVYYLPMTYLLYNLKFVPLNPLPISPTPILSLQATTCLLSVFMNLISFCAVCLFFFFLFHIVRSCGICLSHVVHRYFSQKYLFNSSQIPIFTYSTLTWQFQNLMEQYNLVL